MTQAPGKNFRKGMSMAELFRLFPDDAAAEAWFIETRWPDGITCPVCDSDNIQVRTTHSTMPHRCRDCRKHGRGNGFFSVRTNSKMEGSNLGYQKWVIAIYLYSTNLKSVLSMKLHRDLDITQKSAWYLAHRIRKSYDNPGVMFSGPVEVDETYIGGKEKNKHADKKLRIGRGGVGKTAVVGAKDRDTNQIRAQVVHDTTGATLKGFVRESVVENALVITDEHRAYTGLKNHATVCHSVGEYVNGQAHTNGIESFGLP